jgi:hypothetical protein
MLTRLLAPFTGPGSPSRAPRWFWALALLGAPWLLLASFYLQRTDERTRRLQVTITREDLVRQASSKAAELGLNAEGWREFISFEHNQTLGRYLASRRPMGGERKGPPPGKGPATGRPRPTPLLSPAEFRITLLSPTADQWVRARVDPRGRLVGWRAGGRGLALRDELIPQTEALALAEQAFESWLGDEQAERIGAPDVERTEEVSGGSGYRFTWRARNPRFPDMEYVLTGEVQGRRMLRLETQVEFSETYRQQAIAPREGWESLLTVLRLIFGLVALGYAGWRYAKRSADREVSHRRTLLLAGLLSVPGILLFFGDAIAGAPLADIATQAPDLLLLVSYSVVAFFLLQGLCAGVAYGAGEGEIREGFPGKMTSLDALLTGRVFSRNTGRSVAGGLAIGIWCYFLWRVISYLLPGDMPRVPDSYMPMQFGRFPLFLLGYSIPVGAFYTCAAGLLLPMTFLRRHVQSRFWLRAGMVVAAIVGSSLFEGPQLGWWRYLVDAILLAAAVLAPFLALDFLACLVSVTAMSWLSMVGDLAAVSNYWREHQWALILLGAAPAFLVNLGTWFGRMVPDQEVRPRHAAYLEERMALQAALSAAREAQHRLMPETPPVCPGLSIAASCTPAREVSGDFFDFLPLSGGRMAVVVGEGGNDGLASALTIALTKGYLLYRTSSVGQKIEPHKVLEGLERMLGAMLVRSSGKTSVALAIVDPGQQECSVARLGDWPVMHLLRRDGTVVELSPDGQGLRARMASGDSLVVLTDGVARLLEQGTGETPPEVLRRAAQQSQHASAHDLHRTLLAAARQADSSELASADDLTAVVLTLEGTEPQQAESAA